MFLYLLNLKMIVRDEEKRQSEGAMLEKKEKEEGSLEKA